MVRITKLVNRINTAVSHTRPATNQRHRQKRRHHIGAMPIAVM